MQMLIENKKIRIHVLFKKILLRLKSELIPYSVFVVTLSLAQREFKEDQIGEKNLCFLKDNNDKIYKKIVISFYSFTSYSCLQK